MEFLNDYAVTQFICAFCDTLIDEEVGYCEWCNRMDGALTIAQYQAIFGEDY